MALQTKTFHTGSFDRYSGTSGGYILDLILTEEAIDVQANTSHVTYCLQLRSGPSNRFDWELSATLKLQGAQVAAVTAEHYLDYNSAWVLLTGQAEIPHDPDGSCRLAFEAAITPWNGGNQYTPPALTIADTMALTAVPRASTLAATTVAIGDVATIVVGRKDPAYTHSIFYRFGKLSGYLADAAGTRSETEVRLADTTVLFPIPEDFYDQIPDAPQGSGTLICTTYRGSTQIGQSQEAVFTVMADPARCAPLLQVEVVDVNPATLALTGDAKTMVRGMSDAGCTITAQPRGGAYITQISLCGAPLATPQCTIPAIAGDVVIRVTDSRGFETCRTADLGWVEYTPLSFHGTAARTDPTSGGAVLRAAGKWFSGSFGAAENTLSARCRPEGGDWVSVPVTVTGGDFTLTAALENLDYRRSHTIELEVSDSLQRVSKTLTLPRGIPVFDWGAGDFAFHVPVRFTAKSGTEFTLDLVDGQLTAVI